ncbi:hypothetical protein AgCh_020029 [Apium graveolens]
MAEWGQQGPDRVVPVSNSTSPAIGIFFGELTNLSVDAAERHFNPDNPIEHELGCNQNLLFTLIVLPTMTAIAAPLRRLMGMPSLKRIFDQGQAIGGGISRVLQDGVVWEKVGVNVSFVYGIMPPKAYRAATSANANVKPVHVPFFADGISSVTLDPSSSYMVSSYANKSICMYDFLTGELVVQAVGHGDTVTGVTFLPDCKHLMSRIKMGVL